MLFYRSGDETFQLEDHLPYAELWYYSRALTFSLFDSLFLVRMGTHSSGPALIDGTNYHLSDWLQQNPSAVGYVPGGYSSDSLPFLLKILSVGTALSIQVS